MADPTRPTAEGNFRKTPFANVLLYTHERKMSGSLVVSIEPEDAYVREHLPVAGRSTLVFEKGAIVALGLPRPVELLPDVLRDLGLLAGEAYATAQAAVSQPGVNEVEALLRLRACDPVTLDKGLREQARRRVLALFGYDDGGYAYYSGTDLLGGEGRLRSPEDVRPIVWRGLVANPPDQPAIATVLGKIGARPVRIRGQSDVERYEFGPEVGPAVELLRAMPVTLHHLSNIGLDRATINTLLYLLALTKQLEAANAAETPQTVGVSASPPVATPSRGAPPARVSTTPAAPVSAAPPPPRATPAPPVPTPPAPPKATPPPTRPTPPPAPSVVASKPTSAPAPAPTSAPAPAPPPGDPVEYMDADEHELEAEPEDVPEAAPEAPSAPQPAPSAAPGPMDERLAEARKQLEQMDHQNYYEMLDLPANATADDVRAAFVKVASRWHPDRADTPELRRLYTEVFAHFNTAQLTLGDSRARDAYDESMRGGGGTPASQKKVAAVLETVQEVQRAEILVKRGNHADAEPMLRRAYEVAPDDVSIQVLLAECMIVRDPLVNYDEAQKMLAQVIRNSENANDKALYLMGRLLKAKGDRRYLAFFREALEVNPGNVEAEREVRLAETRIAAAKNKSAGDKITGFFNKLLKK